MRNPKDEDLRKWAKTFQSSEPHKFPGGLIDAPDPKLALRIIDVVRSEALKKYHNRRIAEDPNYIPKSARYEAVRKEVARVLEMYAPPRDYSDNNKIQQQQEGA